MLFISPFGVVANLLCTVFSAAEAAVAATWPLSHPATCHIFPLLLFLLLFLIILFFYFPSSCKAAATPLTDSNQSHQPTRHSIGFDNNYLWSKSNQNGSEPRADGARRSMIAGAERQRPRAQRPEADTILYCLAAGVERRRERARVPHNTVTITMPDDRRPPTVVRSAWSSLGAGGHATRRRRSSRLAQHRVIRARSSDSSAGPRRIAPSGKRPRRPQFPSFYFLFWHFLYQ